MAQALNTLANQGLELNHKLRQTILSDHMLQRVLPLIHGSALSLVSETLTQFTRGLNLEGRAQRLG